MSEESQTLCAGLVAVARELFAGMPLANYVQLSFATPAKPEEEYNVTIHRAGYKTPHQKREEAERARDAYKKEAAALRAGLEAIFQYQLDPDCSLARAEEAEELQRMAEKVCDETMHAAVVLEALDERG